MFYQNLPPHPSPGPMYTLEFEIPESRAMLGPRHLGTPPLGRVPRGPAAPLTQAFPLPRAFLRMLFPEKLDVDKKGRPSTAGSKIKVGLGRVSRGWAQGGGSGPSRGPYPSLCIL